MGNLETSLHLFLTDSFSFIIQLSLIKGGRVEVEKFEKILQALETFMKKSMSKHFILAKMGKL